MVLPSQIIRFLFSYHVVHQNGEMSSWNGYCGSTAVIVGLLIIVDDQCIGQSISLHA